MDLAQLAGKRFGPHHLHITPQAVADFVEATGDDAARWENAAPPGFMAAALFVVAPELLALLYENSVIHGEQSFNWFRPLEIGTQPLVSGEVTRARERGGVHFITFEVEVADDEGVVASGSALFLAAGDSAPTEAAEEHPEPEATDRGNPQDHQLSASRADLIRYAAATRDWNPVHWDHYSAVAAGLPGVVAHGLLQASWALRIAAQAAKGDSPLANAKVRFRNPLPPAVAVDVEESWSDARVDVTLADDDRQYLTARIELTGE